ncbi:MAG: hypothetical protein WC302_00295 [Candidatus Paceibacterota bacterium]|jgi:hypothetical protein
MRKPLFILIFLAAAGGIFFGGMKYGEGKSPLADFEGMKDFQGMQNADLEGMQSGRAGASGEITSMDDESVTIKDSSGTETIVYFSDSVSVRETIDASISDLSVGKQITATGEESSDGIFIANSIQIGSMR